MTVKSRIIETAAGLLAQSADVDVSTRAVCDAAGVTAPTLYHHFGDKDGLLAAVVDFGWATFLETKRAVAAVVHDHVADDIRAGWDNHLEFARENPSFYKLMWSPAVAADSRAVREAYQMLYDRLELGAGHGPLRMSVEAASRIVLSATTGAALSLISQPDLSATERLLSSCARRCRLGHRAASHPVLGSRPRARSRAHDRERSGNPQQQAHGRGHPVDRA